MLPFWPAGFIPPPIIEILMIYFFQYGSFGGGVYRDHLVGQLILWPSRVGVQSNSRHSRPMLWEVLMMQFFNKRKAKNKKADLSTNLWEVGIVDLVTGGEGKTITFQQKKTKMKLSKHTGQRENWTKDKLLLENLVMSHLPSRNCPSGALMCRMLVGI